ncbi:hypothetical protein [Gordonia rubripertincta]|uniref:hypothetical protein n=1 Tax=Gordonia rubripertincta TaxID=36822 RepID=UPI000B8D9A98|nr:hypothetical protein [Gordonia rubripertincta]ASR05651.1 hypothetical protein GCWB2_24400 [Gordonia rubripertincta]
MTSATTVYQLCNSCAVVNAYGDMSGIDTDNTREVWDFMENHGHLVPADETDPSGYWLCECCGLDQLGPGREFIPAA